LTKAPVSAALVAGQSTSGSQCSPYAISSDRKDHSVVLRNEYCFGVPRLRGRRVAQPVNQLPGEPQNNQFSYPPAFYIDAYLSYRAAVASVRAGTFKSDAERSAARARLHERRARTMSALASGGETSIAFAIQMLRSGDVDERDDARGILREMGRRDQLVDSLIASLPQGTDLGTVESITMVLGEMMNPRAIPILIEVLDSPNTDANTKRQAITSLGRLVQRRFDRAEDPEAATCEWLETNGYRSVPTADQETVPEPTVPTP
jgi:hypothetical protein